MELFKCRYWNPKPDDLRPNGDVVFHARPANPAFFFFGDQASHTHPAHRPGHPVAEKSTPADGAHRARSHGMCCAALLVLLLLISSARGAGLVTPHTKSYSTFPKSHVNMRLLQASGRLTRGHYLMCSASWCEHHPHDPSSGSFCLVRHSDKKSTCLACMVSVLWQNVHLVPLQAYITPLGPSSQRTSRDWPLLTQTAETQL